MSYKDNIYNLTKEGDFITFLFKGNDQTAAHLRNFIKNKIYSYCINEVKFIDLQCKDYKEECLALRFGLLVPDNTNCDDHTVGILNIKGPTMVMSNDIKNLKIVYNTPLCYLRENEYLHCELRLKKGCGELNQKWNPVCGITFKDISYGVYQFTFNLIGLLTIDDIMLQLNK